MKFGAVKLPKITITFPHAEQQQQSSSDCSQNNRTNIINEGRHRQSGANRSVGNSNEKNIENLRESCLRNISATDKKIVELAWNNPWTEISNAGEPTCGAAAKLLVELLAEKKEYVAVLEKLDSVLRDIRKAQFARQAKLGLQAVYLELDKVNAADSTTKALDDLKIQEIADVAHRNVQTLNDLCLIDHHHHPNTEENLTTICDPDTALAQAIRSQLLEVPTDSSVRLSRLCALNKTQQVQSRQFVENTLN